MNFINGSASCLDSGRRHAYCFQLWPSKAPARAPQSFASAFGPCSGPRGRSQFGLRWVDWGSHQWHNHRIVKRGTRSWFVLSSHIFYTAQIHRSKQVSWATVSPRMKRPWFIFCSGCWLPLFSAQLLGWQMFVPLQMVGNHLLDTPTVCQWSTKADDFPVVQLTNCDSFPDGLNRSWSVSIIHRSFDSFTGHFFNVSSQRSWLLSYNLMKNLHWKS